MNEITQKSNVNVNLDLGYCKMKEIELHLFMKKIKTTLFYFAFSLIILSFSKDNLEKGTASYYGKSFEGRKTASGEILRNDSLTAAHKTLKFGTIVKVTNLKNDSVVVVKINDRLPKSSTRVIDLTIGAAKQLNFIKAGLTPVTLEILEKK
ncbi:MAG: septal ring lytic transglycosylase RlpA family protein [Crocinitomicaceae bacterium]